METKASTTNHSSASPEGARTAAHRPLPAPFERAEDRLFDANEKVQEFIRQNPGTCLLGAVAIGFFAGSLASRR
jgi:ElaB/YqjD/DUF883 family membrane-anchored ribosome-binding protein